MLKGSSWQGKQVYITGVNGFVGSHLAKALVERGAQVYGLIRDQKKGTFLFHENIAEKITLIQGDICDKALHQRVLTECYIDSVFHLAAQVEVGVALTNPYLTFETNIKGTYALLDAVRESAPNIESVVVASSDKAYGSYPMDAMPYKEDYPLVPEYPYDVSKACADMIARSYASDVFNLPLVITRFCNIYGPGQMNFSALMPDAIRSALGYSTFVPRGSGEQVRDYIYVEDVVSLYLAIAQGLASTPKKYQGQVFNAGTNSFVSVAEILTTIFTLIGNMEALQSIKKSMKDKETRGEIHCQYMDFEKVNAYVGWSPQHDLAMGMQKTIDWYKHYFIHNSQTEMA